MTSVEYGYPNWDTEAIRPMYRTRSGMPLLLPIILAVWLFVAVAAIVLCVAARRTDAEIARAELAPVVEIHAAALSRRHTAA
jgi:hypothetical protein